MRGLLLLAVVVAALAAGEAPPDAATVRFISPTGSLAVPLGRDPGPQVGQGRDGILVQWLGWELSADRLDFVREDIPGLGLFVTSARAVGGAKGPADGRLHLDGRTCDRADQTFRGLVTGSALVLLREAGQRRLRLRLDEVGDFAGDLRDDRGAWSPVTGSAATAEFVIALDAADGRLQRLRLEEIVLARPAPAPPARLDRQHPRRPLQAEGEVLRLRFDAEGRADTVQVEKAVRLESRLPASAPPGPALPPAPAP